MARKSRYIVVDSAAKIEKAENQQRTKAAVYVRESAEDSSPLETQVTLIIDYINKSEDLILYQVFADNGFTGVDFERPAFVRMIDDMKAGRFQAVIVKDGSRLGRNYLEAGTYIESVFPTHGIRFISINDNYDSVDARCERDGISIPLRNIMNEQYSKDLSRKLSSAFRVKQLAGDFIGAYATYGYQKESKSRSRLVIDEQTAPVIKHIFERKLAGISDGAIAEELNNAGILSPFAYRYEMGQVKAEKYKNMIWRRGTISQMLKNRIYLGDMVQGRHRKSLSRKEARHNTPRSEWLIVKDTHPAIIPDEVFEEVQKIIEARKEQYKHRVNEAGWEKTVNPFKGKIFCSDCGRAMVIGISRSKKASRFYYRCRLAVDSNGIGCVQRSIRVEDVEKAVMETVKKLAVLYKEKTLALQEENDSIDAKEKCNKLIKDLENLRIERLHYLKLSAGLYQDFVDCLLNQEEYLFAADEYKKKIINLDNRNDSLKRLVETYREKNYNSKKLIDTVFLFNEIYGKNFNCEILNELFNRIKVHQDCQLTISLKCMDLFQDLDKTIRKRGEMNYEVE